MASSTIGQYLPGNSPVHKLDPRAKIVTTLLLMVSVFLCKNYISIALAFVLAVAICKVSKIKAKIVFKGLKPILYIVIFTALLNLFYGTGEPLIQLGRLKITMDGVENSIFMALRIVILVIYGLMLTYTTSPTSLTDATEALLKPLKLFKVDVHTFAMTMTIALRFIPTLVEEVEKITAAQKSRGANLDSGGIFTRAKAIVPIMIPLFVSSFRRANDLEYAMDCRCYHGGNNRTKMNVMKMNKFDVITLVATIVYFVGIVLIRIFTQSVIWEDY